VPAVSFLTLLAKLLSENDVISMLLSTKLDAFRAFNSLFLGGNSSGDCCYSTTILLAFLFLEWHLILWRRLAFFFWTCSSFWVISLMVSMYCLAFYFSSFTEVYNAEILCLYTLSISTYGFSLLILSGGTLLGVTLYSNFYPMPARKLSF
jgi:hypothetical protein